MDMYYLAYGSNLNLNDMSHRCPNATLVGTTKLYDYRLVYKGVKNDASYLTIEKSDGNYVPVGIFKLSDNDIDNLDYYEGFPYLYHKQYFIVSIDGELKKALIYVMNDKFDYNIPSGSYIRTCLKGYSDVGFDFMLLNKAYNDTKKEILNRKKYRKL